MKGLLGKAIKAIWFLFFFLMIFMPRQLQAIKILLIGFLILLKILQGGFKVSFYTNNRYINAFLVCWFTSALLRIFSGLIHSNSPEGIIASVRLDIIYPVILLFMFFLINSREELTWVNDCILIAGTACALYTFIFYLVNIGIWPRNLFFAFDYTTGFGAHEGYTHMTNTNGSMLIPILPMIFVSFMTTPKKERGLFRWVSLILCFVAAVLTGRRMLWAAIPFSVFFVLLLALLNPKKISEFQSGTNWKRLGIILIVVAAVLVFVVARGIINIQSVITRFKAVLAGGEEAGERSGQALALINGFLRYPVFGNGAGASASGSIRNETFTWAYELSYHAGLFQSGLVGFSLYVIALLSILFGCISGAKKGRASYSTYVSLLAGTMMGMIANASNPYFSSSFDFLWWILWPVGYIYVDDKLFYRGIEWIDCLRLFS